MRSRAFTAAAAAALIAGAALVARFSGTVAGGADSSGYLNSARLFASLRLREAVRRVPGVDPDRYPPGAFVPLGMRPGPVPHTAVPTYPPGLPLHLAAASLLVGLDRAPVVVNVAAWIAAVVLVYRLARRLAAPHGWCAAAAVVFALFPLTVLQSVRVMSDVLATAWCSAAALWSLKGRTRPEYAAAAGVGFGVAVLVRPTDALLAPALALALGPAPRTLLAAAAGAAPALAGLGLYNLAEYGRVLTTGYTGIAPLVSLANAPSGLLHFGRWLVTFLGAPAFALVAWGICGAFRGDRRQAMLLTWAGALLAFYAAYEQSVYGWWRLRFILPALPALLASAVLAGRDLALRARPSPLLRRLTAGALAGTLGWALAASGYWVVTRRVWREGRNEAEYPRCVAWAESQLPPGSALLAMQTSGAVYFYGRSPIVRYDLMDEPTYTRFLADARDSGVEPFALLFRNDRLEFERRWPGAWVRVGGLEQASLWRLRAPEAAPPGR
ncbi:MAG TPA: hypothetical protein VMT19_02410 [Thermoanaerobaculaceae bacterium]|nr:hypothetical protein [Thermoanaerobaculaceae bacterium]